MTTKLKPDIILDTNTLSDVIAQYYENDIIFSGVFRTKYRLSKKAVTILNGILFRSREDMLENVVVASTAAFVEIARKFDDIVQNRFSLEQFKAFIDAKPSWFVVAAVNTDLVSLLSRIPADVRLKGGAIKPLEWADIIHVATALSRGDNIVFSTTDSSLQALELLEGKIV